MLKWEGAYGRRGVGAVDGGIGGGRRYRRRKEGRFEFITSFSITCEITGRKRLPRLTLTRSA